MQSDEEMSVGGVKDELKQQFINRSCFEKRREEETERTAVLSTTGIVQITADFRENIEHYRWKLTGLDLSSVIHHVVERCRIPQPCPRVVFLSIKHNVI
jgi:hypothetical protein